MRGYYNHQTSMEKIADDVRNSAYRIIEKKHATYYGIAMSVTRICRAVMMDEKSILPVSVTVRNRYGIGESVLSLPAIVGAAGVETLPPFRLSEEEQAKIRESAKTLNDIFDSLAL